MYDQDGKVVSMLMLCSCLTQAVPLAKFCQDVIGKIVDLQWLITEQAHCINFATSRLSRLIDNPGTKLLPFSQSANMEYF